MPTFNAVLRELASLMLHFDEQKVVENDGLQIASTLKNEESISEVDNLVP